ncbi:putative protein-serine/threonine kinase CMGC-CDK-CRK7-CDK9 family [Helianthus anomalus]
MLEWTYSNVYKARDLIIGKIVALKKVRVNTLEPENVKFMAREILILKKLNHVLVIKLEELVTSRMSSSLYLVFEYVEHDLAGLAATQGVKLTESQVKCFIKELLSGLDHFHKNGVLHRDMKGFWISVFLCDPQNKQPMTSRVVTLWYQPPELLLGATYFGVGVDIWSAGCILAELLAGKPIMPGRTKVEQLHKIFKLCVSPSEEYWKKYHLPNTTLFKPRPPYKRCTKETFRDFPTSSLPLLESLLAINPDERVSAAASLISDVSFAHFLTQKTCSLCDYESINEWIRGDIFTFHLIHRGGGGAWPAMCIFLLIKVANQSQPTHPPPLPPTPGGIPTPKGQRPAQRQLGVKKLTLKGNPRPKPTPHGLRVN